MTQFVIVGLGVERQSLTSIVNSLVKALYVSMAKAFELKLIDVLLSEHGTPGFVEVKPPVVHVQHPSPTWWSFKALALLRVRLQLKKEVRQIRPIGVVTPVEDVGGDQGIEVRTALMIFQIFFLDAIFERFVGPSEQEVVSGRIKPPHVGKIGIDPSALLRCVACE
jgi:hypothetical protein